MILVVVCSCIFSCAWYLTPDWRHRCQAEFPTVICTSGQIISQPAQSSLSTFRFDSHPSLSYPCNICKSSIDLFHPPLISLAPKNVKVNHFPPTVSTVSELLEVQESICREAPSAFARIADPCKSSCSIATFCSFAILGKEGIATCDTAIKRI